MMKRSLVKILKIYEISTTALLSKKSDYVIKIIFLKSRKIINARVAKGHRGLFPFRKRSLPFLTVNAIFGNQAFSRGRCNICSGLNYNEVTETFLNSLRKN